MATGKVAVEEVAPTLVLVTEIVMAEVHREGAVTHSAALGPMVSMLVLEKFKCDKFYIVTARYWGI